MRPPSESKVCGFRDISSCNACTLCCSASLAFSFARTLFSRSRLLASSCCLASLNFSSSSSNCTSSLIPNVFSSTILSRLSPLFARLFASELRVRCVLNLRSGLETLDRFSSNSRFLLTSRCILAQLSTTPGTGSSSSSQSSSGASSGPASCGTKHINTLDTSASVAVSAANGKAFRCRYACQSMCPPSVRISSIAAAAISSAHRILMP
mmetsp:Transcript_20661/g.33344  ORF Transcript_20661/g.33344 Transcript_20661/m.33344 type:complete len:209 (-) Transcript_20661:178-804(-)